MLFRLVTQVGPSEVPPWKLLEPTRGTALLQLIHGNLRKKTLVVPMASMASNNHSGATWKKIARKRYVGEYRYKLTSCKCEDACKPLVTRNPASFDKILKKHFTQLAHCLLFLSHIVSIYSSLFIALSRLLSTPAFAIHWYREEDGSSHVELGWLCYETTLTRKCNRLSSTASWSVVASFMTNHPK